VQAIQRITIQATLPERIAKLRALSGNLYWSWTPAAFELFREINPNVFDATHNPVRVLNECSQANLERVAHDPAFLERFDAIIKDFEAYMDRKDTWYAKEAAAGRSIGGSAGGIAYFSMEYGFHESLQIYSGGLGVLAGDHCKSASDLGLPFQAVGMLFGEGYFHQRINSEGWQEEWYETIIPSGVPLERALDTNGKPVKVSVEISGRVVFATAWKLPVGRINVYLMDTNLEDNTPEDRGITARLYGGNQELRVAQELVLGVGGIRALRAMNIQASVYHMNEGHAAFLGLERVREMVAQGLSFDEAAEAVAAGAIFTTHTPVPAGNDAFAVELVEKKLGGYWYTALGLSREDFLNIARHDQPWGPTFSMTVLALKLSRQHNGVSELHGEVSRRMWGFLWPGAESVEVPITHVTNGIHTRSFLAPELAELYNKHFGKDWDDRLEHKETWQVDEIPDKDLWGARVALKRNLIRFVRERLRIQRERNGEDAAHVAAASSALRDDVLTIGFARRFATYKRATLLFRDLERLRKIVNNSDRPVQFIFAGKAHPADNPGKTFIQAINKLSHDAELEGKVIFLEDYDMNVARHLVQGCDIWLNNPRRPLEASGTSGEKASLNGCINFSVLDGWWREAYDGTNGWNIGSEREYGTDDDSLRRQDEADSKSLYETLEHEIVPLFYGNQPWSVEAGRTFNHGWLERVRNAIRTVGPEYSMQRQVLDYVHTLYAPASARAAKVDAVEAKTLAAWKKRVTSQWSGVRLEASADASAAHTPNAGVPITGRAYLGALEAADLKLEAILTRVNAEAQAQGMAEIANRATLELGAKSADGWTSFTGTLNIPEAGSFDIGVRAIPFREDLAQALELGISRWA
jgi:glycogen phosphorylase